ncbi:unnamed protein product [Notodromas monacha]|uniref:Uncharacterized protein n=1 Tax=Notodromas monacha TaxID=399045 RepID=A0A7R9BMD3_9CRUS|nr:unnamed protein product [Notodromas monacha]CAG0917052.1 unnamed protein product [Notodromas monacha]
MRPAAQGTTGVSGSQKLGRFRVSTRLAPNPPQAINNSSEWREGRGHLHESLVWTPRELSLGSVLPGGGDPGATPGVLGRRLAAPVKVIRSAQEKCIRSLAAPLSLITLALLVYLATADATIFGKIFGSPIMAAEVFRSSA